MVEIKAFKGILYNEEKIKDLKLVVTPPYDVIDDKERGEYSRFSDYNMVNLILGDKEDGYKKVAQSFKEWQDKGIFKKDDEDSVYVYSQTFRYNGNTFTRTGFVSLVKLEELGKGILPHEKTLEKPFKDRLSLLNAARANFGFVFILYDDREKKIDGFLKNEVSEKRPDMDFEDKYGINHRLWKVSDRPFINRVRVEMQQYQCIIADGHHRYRSVLEFKKEHPELEDALYTMCCFVNSFNEGLFILPIDRFVFNLKNINVDNVLNELAKYFKIEEVKDVKELISRVDSTKVMVDKTINLKNHVFGMYCFLNNKSYLLKLKDNNILDKYSPDKTDVYRKLDVNILHQIVFKDILGISEEDQYKGIHIEYTKGSKRALDRLQKNHYQFAFFLNAPLMREIFLTARAGETMPQKSTYFYPKVYSGLVINKIEK